MEKKFNLLQNITETILVFCRKTKLPPAMLGLFALLFVVPFFLDDQYLLRLLISSLLFGCLAMGFDFCAGFINIVNVGFAAFMGMGAYTAGILAERLDISPWLGVFPAVMVAGVCGFLTGILTLRLRGIFVAIMTWFLGLTLYSVTANLVGLTRGQMGLSVPPLFNSPSVLPYYYVVLIIAVFVYVICQLILKSYMGLAFASIGQDMESAEASGVNPTKYKVINFTISCMVAGLMGWFYAHFIGILTPEVMHTKVSVEVLALAYLGGRGSLWGGLVAALIFIPVFDYMNSLMEIKLIIYGLLLVAVMIFYPGGLASILYQAKSKVVDFLKKRKTRESKCEDKY